MKHIFLALSITLSVANLVCMEPDPQLPEPQLLGTINEQPSMMVLSNNQKLLAMLLCLPNYKKNIQIYDTTKCELITTLGYKSQELPNIRFSNDNTQLQIASDKTFRVCDAASGRYPKNYVATKTPHAEYLSYKIWNDSLWSISHEFEGYFENEKYYKNKFIIILLKNLPTRSLSDIPTKPIRIVNATKNLHSVSPDGKNLAYHPDSHFGISVMNIETGQTIYAHEAYWISPNKLFISNDQSIIFFEDKRIHLGDAVTSTNIYKMTPQEIKLLLKIPPAYNTKFSSNSQLIAVQTRDTITTLQNPIKNTLQIIDLSNPNTTQSLNLFDTYCIQQEFWSSYPIALSGTTIAFPIPSGNPDEIDPKCDKTIIGVFNINPSSFAK